MDIFLEMSKRFFRNGLHFFNDPSVGLRCIIAVHNRRPKGYGAALGGVRMAAYNNIEEATYDVLRLAQGMTFKNLLADLPVGGGKAVILYNEGFCGDKEKRQNILSAFARCVDGLKGDYITAPDAGTNVSDMLEIGRHTKYVVGLLDPSPYTARGVLAGIKVGAKHLWGNDSLKGKKVLIQGAGKTGSALAGLLHMEGSQLIISDINIEIMMKVCEEYKAIHCHPEDIFNMDADIFAPCARGAIINNKTIHHVIKNFKMVCGAANNQLEFGKEHGRQLKNAGILYLPDFVVNCGGVITSHYELINGYEKAERDSDFISRKVEEQVTKQITTVLENSKAGNVLATNEVAEEMALKILANEEKSD